MNRLHWGRQLLLLALCSGTMAVLGNALFGNPKASVRAPAAVGFPPQVPLDGWQTIDSQALADRVLWNSKAIPGWHYRYQSNLQILNVELRYLSDNENSQQGLPFMLENFTQFAPTVFQSPNNRYQSGIGFYSLFSDPQTAYFSTCINPRGGGTVTAKQFQQNRLIHDMQFNRLLSWILGKNKLMDNRCLWTMLSLPRDRSAPEASDQILEAAGMDWLRWWQSHFPEP